MSMKKRKFLTALTAVFSSALMIPIAAAATDSSEYQYSEDISQGSVTITEDTCKESCPGHRIHNSSSGANAYTVTIASGTHNIILDGLTIDASKAPDSGAFVLGSGAKVTMTLVGENILSSGGSNAGILVNSGSELTIKGDGSLNVSGGGGAGIGSQGMVNSAGKITIESGTIIAKGGPNSAGIGGSGAGGAGTIAIKGGSVNATGGDNGGAGIGCGNSGSGGDITISGGTVTANGGANSGSGIGRGGLSNSSKASVNVTISDGTVTANGGAGGAGIGVGSANTSGAVTISGGTVTALEGSSSSGGSSNYSIECGSLSSGTKGSPIITANSINENANVSDFNGLMLKKASGDRLQDTYVVYGDATLPNTGFQLTNQTMEIPAGTSLTIPNQGLNLDMYSSITGSGMIINADRLNGNGSIDYDNLSLKVSLSAQDIYTAQDLIYNGNDLTSTAFRLNTVRIDDSGMQYAVDTDGWSPTTIKRGNVIVTQIKEAGTYTVTYTRSGYGDDYEPVVSTQFTVAPRTLTDDMISPIDTQSYTGNEIKPDLNITYNGMTLVVSTDYTAVYTDNTDIGDATVTVTGRGNYQGEVVTGFYIDQAPIDAADVTIKLDNDTYDGTAKTADVSVKLNGKTLAVEDDYTVRYSTDDFTSAGVITATVEGTGNYKGQVQKTFEIKKKSLSITDATAVGREYDGTAEVQISGVTLEGFIPGDENDVSADLSGLTGSLPSPDADEYDTVTLEDVKLTGNKASNYVVSPSLNEDVPLTEPIEITTITPPTPELSGDYSLNRGGTAYDYTISVNNAVDGVDYQYKIDDRGWQNSNTFKNLEPGSVHTFQARAKEDLPNVNESDIGYLEDVEVPKLEQEAPAEFTLTFEENGDGTFTAVIPSRNGAVYSFDGIDFSESNTKEDCDPNTEYTGYIKYPEDDTHYESPVTSNSQVSPMLVTADPVIEPNGGSFYGSQTITITSEDGAVIYYTLDGSDPSSASTEYTGPFVVDTTMMSGGSLTIKAIAVKQGMENSGIVSAEFSQQIADVQYPDLTTVPGELVNHPQFNTLDAITAELTAQLSAKPGNYNYQNMKFYDISVGYYDENGSWIKLNAEAEPYFPLEGYEITIPYPDGTEMNGFDFIAAHMFSETSAVLGPPQASWNSPT